MSEELVPIPFGGGRLGPKPPPPVCPNCGGPHRLTICPKRKRPAPTPSLTYDIATERLCKDCELAGAVSEQGAEKLKAAALRRNGKWFIVTRAAYDAIVAEHPKVKA